MNHDSEGLYRKTIEAMGKIYFKRADEYIECKKKWLENNAPIVFIMSIDAEGKPHYTKEVKE